MWGSQQAAGAGLAPHALSHTGPLPWLVPAAAILVPTLQRRRTVALGSEPESQLLPEACLATPVDEAPPASVLAGRSFPSCAYYSRPPLGFLDLFYLFLVVLTYAPRRERTMTALAPLCLIQYLLQSVCLYVSVPRSAGEGRCRRGAQWGPVMQGRPTAESTARRSRTRQAFSQPVGSEMLCTLHY